MFIFLTKKKVIYVRLKEKFEQFIDFELSAMDKYTRLSADGQNRVFCETCHGKFFHLDLFFFFEQRGSLLYNGWQKNRSVSHFLQPPAID